MADTLLFVAGSAVDAKKQPAHHTISTITKINRLNGFSGSQVRSAVRHYDRSDLQMGHRGDFGAVEPRTGQRAGKGPYTKNKLRSSVGYQPYAISRSQK